MKNLKLTKELFFTVCYVLFFLFWSLEIWKSVTSAFGILTIPEIALYYIVQLNLPFFIIIYCVFKNKTNNSLLGKKIILVIVSFFYYFILLTYIAYNIWYEQNFLLGWLKYLIIQLVFAVSLYKLFVLNKKNILSNIILFIILSLLALGYAYYRYDELINFCKEINTKEDSLYCLKKLDYKRVGYTDNLIIGKDAAYLFTINPKFKKQAEEIKGMKIIVDGDKVQWDIVEEKKER